MVCLKHKTRENSDPQGKQRVYFCCHPNDFEQYFETITDEILEKQNCCFWYTDEPIDCDEDFLMQLKEMQLFVMPVTTNLLSTKNQALDIEFKFAIEHHIPVLPLMQERGLAELFNEKCGDLHFLDKYDTDVTAIHYDEKLQKYLQSVLIGDKLAEKIRDEFIAYAFLSYRKKDRKYAQELTRLIHKNEVLRDVAIWYDEFLVPGENFNDSIKQVIKKSELFLLTVTPNLVNENNYIIENEYPTAIQEGKIIFPAEIVATDKNKLYDIYKNIPEPIDVHNDVELSEALLKSFQNMKVKKHDLSPKHNFLIGLSYLSGVDVEVDHKRAIDLITDAAEAGLIEAMQKLVDIYKNGIGVKRNYRKACEWQSRINQCIFNELLDDYKKIEEMHYPKNRTGVTDKHATKEEMEVAYERHRASQFLKGGFDAKVIQWIEKQIELSDMYWQFGATVLAENVLIQTIGFLSNNPNIDITNIYDTGIISNPNYGMINTTFFDLHIKLIEYFMAEMKYSLVEKWRIKVLNWLQQVENRLQGNRNVLQFRREVQLEFARILYRQGKYELVKDELWKLINDTVASIHNTAEGTGLLDIFIARTKIFDILSDTFMLLGDTCVKLGLKKEAFDAYDEAVASDKYSQERSRINRQIIGKLRMSEISAALNDAAKSIEYIKDVEKQLKYTTENTLETVALKREYFRTLGQIRLLNGDDSVVESFEEALKFSKEMVEQAPYVENVFYMVELYEKLYAATKENEIAGNYIDSMYELATSKLFNDCSPKTKEELGNTYILIYKCNKDLQLLEKAYYIFYELSKCYPEVSRFLMKLNEIKGYMS